MEIYLYEFHQNMYFSLHGLFTCLVSNGKESIRILYDLVLRNRIILIRGKQCHNKCSDWLLLINSHITVRQEHWVLVVVFQDVDDKFPSPGLSRIRSDIHHMDC